MAELKVRSCRRAKKRIDRMNSRNVSRRIARAAAGVVIVSTSAQFARSANITFSTPTTIAGDTDVFNAGASSYAYDWSGISATVNGTTFTGSSSNLAGGTNVTLTFFKNDGGTTFAGTTSPYTSLSASYQNLLGGADWTSGAPVTVTLSSLTVGHEYVAQIWVNDSRSAFSSRTETVPGASGSVTLGFSNSGSGGGIGQYALSSFAAGNTTQSFTISPGTGGIAQLNALQVRDVTGVWSGAASGNWNSGDANFTGNQSFSAITSLSTPVTAIYFADTDGLSNPVTNSNITVQAGGMSIGSVNFQNSNVSYTFNSADANGISGNTSVLKSGFGLVTLSGTNTYLGSTAINGGVLLLNVADNGTSGPLGNGGNITFGGGTLKYSSADTVDYSSRIASGTSTGPISIDTNGQSITFASALNSSQSGGLTKFGSGNLTLSAANSYSGPTTVSAGTLNINNGATGVTTSSAIGTGALIISDGATIDNTSGVGVVLGTNNAQTWNGNFTFAGSNDLNLGAGNVTMTAATNTTQTITLKGHKLTVGGNITTSNSNVSLSLLGNGTLNLGGSLNNGSYAGALTIASGATLNYASSAPQTFSNIAAGTGTINLTGSGGSGGTGGGNVTISGDQNFSGTLNISGENLIMTGGNNGPNTGLGNAAAINVTNGTITLLGADNSFLGSAGNTTLTLNPGAVLTQSGAYTDHLKHSLILAGGTLATSGAASADGSYYGTYNLDGGVTAGGTTATSTISATGIALSQTGGTVFNVSSGATHGIDLNVTGTFTTTNYFGGGSGVIKTGNGTMVLAASNSYGSSTTISAGTLLANATAATGTSNITVAAGSGNYTGAKLGGNETITGTVSLTGNATARFGGIIAAGASGNTSTGLGTLKTGAQTWGNGAVYQWKIGSSAGAGNVTLAGINGTPGTTYDQLLIGTGTSGQLTVPSTGGTAVTIELAGALTGIPIVSGTQFNWAIAQVGTGNSTIAGGSGTISASTGAPVSSSIFALDTSTLFTVNGSAPSPSSFSLYFETINGNNDLVLHYEAAPEPGTALLVLLGSAPPLLSRRRKQRTERG